MSDTQTCSITIDLAFDWPPETPKGFPGLIGGIRIVADGKPITGTIREDLQAETSEPIYDANGTPIDTNRWEFVGDDHYINLPEIQDAFMPLLEGEYERYQEIPAELSGMSENTVVIFSPLDGDLIRMAVQPIDYERNKWDRPVGALVGIPVDPEDLCRELIPCYQQCVGYVKESYKDWDADLRDDIDEVEANFQERISTLESYID